MQHPTAGIEVLSPKSKRVTDYDLWPSLALASVTERGDSVAYGAKAEIPSCARNDVNDPEHHFAVVNYRIAKDLCGHFVDAAMPHVQ
jgi:hypothetical protein